MAKSKTIYRCADCGAQSAKWQGQCADCGAWNSLQEAAAASGARGAARVATLADVAEERTQRYGSGFSEFDRVLGGGIVPGSVVLLGGDPGVGKSTLLQQVAARLPNDLKTVYATGEESLRQVADRSRRLGLENPHLRLLADTSLANIIAEAQAVGAAVLVIDSIQTVVSDDVASAAGSVSQLRESVSRIVQFAKQNEVSVLLVGHVTKEGAIAGPRVVEHMVDTVLYFENDPASRYTVVRAVKNRFGASSEMGVLAMTEAGFREVKNPSAIFLPSDQEARPGSLVSVAWEGSRPLLIEVQALVADGFGKHPKRLAQGIDQSRLALLVAVLHRHGGMALTSDDVFVNIAGGLKIGETAVDVPIVLAIVSSLRDRPCGQRCISFGELGLAGEVRPVRYGTERLAEAAKQGFRRAIVPRANVPKRLSEDIECVAVSTLAEALDAVFED